VHTRKHTHKHMRALRFVHLQIELPLKHRELFSQGVATRSGLLLYGPPGRC